VIKFLLDNGADVNALDYTDRTCLMYAYIHKVPEVIIQMLFKLGILADIVDLYGNIEFNRSIDACTSKLGAKDGVNSYKSIYCDAASRIKHNSMQYSGLNGIPEIQDVGDRNNLSNAKYVG